MQINKNTAQKRTNDSNANTKDTPLIKRQRQNTQSELEYVLSNDFKVMPEMFDDRKFSAVEEVKNYLDKVSELGIICNRNKENIKNWSTKPILILTDPKPLNKDTLFSNVPNNNIIKKYFTHVSYLDFLSNLNAAWEKALPHLKGKNYITVGKFLDECEDEGKNLKSSYWATNLLLKNNPDFQPKDMIDTFDFKSNHCESSKDIVLVDDATYSGLQMANIVPMIIEKLNTINKDEKINIHLVIPYMSDFSKKSIKEEFECTVQEYNISDKVSLEFYSQQKIENIDDIEIDENQEVKKFLKKKLRFLTTFDHKIADYESLGHHVADVIQDLVKPVYKIENNIVDTSLILDKK